MRSSLRTALSLLAAGVLVCGPCFAFQSPLSEESVREAYFVGQRHDESFARFLEKYTKQLPAPKTGPYISSVAFFTPFARVAQASSEHTMGYSAQQAAIDHRGQAETVEVIVEIQLTDSYGAVIARPTGSRSGTPIGYAARPYDFWKDFEVRVFANDEEEALRPFSSHGEPHFLCSENGGCTLTGATLHFEFLAEAFSGDSATAEVYPPKGDAVSVVFDLTNLR